MYDSNNCRHFFSRNRSNFLMLKRVDYDTSICEGKSSAARVIQLLIGLNDKKNKESITIIWFDPRIGSDDDIEAAKERIRSMNDFVIFTTDLDECVKYIKLVETEKIFLIASEILAQTSSLPQIDSIFIFSRKTDQYEQLLSKCSKITGVYAQFDDLRQSIKEQVNFANRQIPAFSFFDQREKSTKDLSKESSEFLWFQLFHYAVTRMPRNQRAKEEIPTKRCHILVYKAVFCL
ncbi:unnamed protein product [Rotaria magnacalcarata]|uniref:Uncharacterized protein n=2 Tax=Rotaria magnacalcarata TaxID=392030 RepID=A0A817A669_9BILA|nr:unnamed protein product [Rotaria magnacalcarata]